MTTVAIMQPYSFPYLGYLQLCHVADIFVFLDDVHFIKRGFVNRNRIAVGGRESLFSIPIKGASQNRMIGELMVGEDYGKFERKFLTMLRQGYSKACSYADGLDYVLGSLSKSMDGIAAIAMESVKRASDLLGVKTEFMQSSLVAPDRVSKGADAIVEICSRLGATRYVNPPGGRHLYSPGQFADAGIELRFLQPSLRPYSQQCGEFLPGLSVIDPIMCLPSGDRSQVLIGYELGE